MDCVDKRKFAKNRVSNATLWYRVWECPMSMDEVIDTVVASCDGNLRGAVMALLLVNERLESELEYFREMAVHQAPSLQPIEPVN